VRRGDIALAVLRGAYGKPRPVLTVQSSQVTAAGYTSVLVCPLTSEISGDDLVRVIVEATPETGLHARSEIMIEKLSALPRDKLRDVIGRLDDAGLRAVDRALLLVLGIGTR
jgi:mRNA interferase MazF